MLAKETPGEKNCYDIHHIIEGYIIDESAFVIPGSGAGRTVYVPKGGKSRSDCPESSLRLNSRRIPCRAQKAVLPGMTERKFH